MNSIPYLIVTAQLEENVGPSEFDAVLQGAGAWNIKWGASGKVTAEIGTDVVHQICSSAKGIEYITFSYGEILTESTMVPNNRCD